jgi:hypothetical protein
MNRRTSSGPNARPIRLEAQTIAKSPVAVSCTDSRRNDSNRTWKMDDTGRSRTRSNLPSIRYRSANWYRFHEKTLKMPSGTSEKP